MDNRESKCYGGGRRKRSFWLGPAAILLVLVMGIGSAVAFDIPTGSPDWKLRWDNTLRYSLITRLLPKDGSLIGDINADDGDRNFNRGIVQNRIDILSETDLIYKKDFGIHASAAFWYDQIYNENFDNDSPGTYNQLGRNGRQQVRLSAIGNKYFAGPDGELLDAFAFGKVPLGDTQLYLKAGRHAVMWGEVLLNPFNGLNYGQAPLDLGKATSTPGIEVKELFRPLNSVSGVLNVSSELTFAFQYFMEWQRDLVPEGGTYLAASDLNLAGDNILLLGLDPLSFMRHGRDITPNEFKDFGVSAKWSPMMLHGGTVGFYYRQFSDKLPQTILNFGDMTYHFVYPSDIHVFGLSYANNIFGGSLGAELSARHDMPLRSEASIISSASQLPSDGNTLGARGDTIHFLVNYLGILKKTPLWDAGSYIVEFDYNNWLQTTENESMFKGRSSYTTIDRATEEGAGIISVNFTPQWLQVLPGVDLSLPMSVSYGLWGISAMTNAGAENEGTWGVGLQFDIYNKYKVGLSYVSFFGTVDVDPTTGVATNKAGAGSGTAGLRDRDFLALTLKTSF